MPVGQIVACFTIWIGVFPIDSTKASSMTTSLLISYPQSSTQPHESQSFSFVTSSVFSQSEAASSARLSVDHPSTKSIVSTIALHEALTTTLKPTIRLETAAATAVNSTSNRAIKAAETRFATALLNSSSTYYLEPTFSILSHSIQFSNGILSRRSRQTSVYRLNLTSYSPEAYSSKSQLFISEAHSSKPLTVLSTDRPSSFAQLSSVKLTTEIKSGYIEHSFSSITKSLGNKTSNVPLHSKHTRPLDHQLTSSFRKEFLSRSAIASSTYISFSSTPKFNTQSLNSYVAKHSAANGTKHTRNARSSILFTKTDRLGSNTVSLSDMYMQEPISTAAQSSELSRILVHRSSFYAPTSPVRPTVTSSNGGSTTITRTMIMIAGGGGGGALILLIVILLCFVRTKRRRQNRKKEWKRAREDEYSNTSSKTDLKAYMLTLRESEALRSPVVNMGEMYSEVNDAFQLESTFEVENSSENRKSVISISSCTEAESSIDESETDDARQRCGTFSKALKSNKIETCSLIDVMKEKRKSQDLDSCIIEEKDGKNQSSSGTQNVMASFKGKGGSKLGPNGNSKLPPLMTDADVENNVEGASGDSSAPLPSIVNDEEIVSLTSEGEAKQRTTDEADEIDNSSNIQLINEDDEENKRLSEYYC